MRLHTDLLVLDNSRGHIVEHYAGIRDDLRTVRRVLLDVEDRADLTDAECLSVMVSHDLDQPPDTLPTADELLTSGRMELILDEAVRSQLQTTLQVRDFAREVFRSIRSEQVSLMSRYPELFTLELGTLDNGLEQVRPACRLDAMRASPAFVADMVLNTRGFEDYVGYPFGGVDQVLEDLHTQLDTAASDAHGTEPDA